MEAITGKWVCTPAHMSLRFHLKTHTKKTTPEHRNHLTKHNNVSDERNRIAQITFDQHLENLHTDKRIGVHLKMLIAHFQKHKQRTAHVHTQLCKHYNTRRGTKMDNRHRGANRSRRSPQRQMIRWSDRKADMKTVHRVLHGTQQKQETTEIVCIPMMACFTRRSSLVTDGPNSALLVLFVEEIPQDVVDLLHHGTCCCCSPLRTPNYCRT